VVLSQQKTAGYIMLKKRKAQRRITILILASMLAMMFYAPHNRGTVQAAHIKGHSTIMASHCHRSQGVKTAASSTCQQTAPLFCAILPESLDFLQALIKSAIFFTIMATLAIARNYPIFKPPRRLISSK